MSKTRVWVLLLVATISGLQAREFRAPYVTVPFSHDFDPSDDEGFRYQLYSTPFCRQAHRAFTKHGTATKHLSALFFNEDDFRLTKIFPDAQVPHNTKYYNPYMRTMKIKPRATYYEQGIQLGASIDRTVWRDRGRLGVRVNVPFKSVEIERKDGGGRYDSQTQDVVARQINDATGDNLGYAVRLDFIEALRKNAAGNSSVNYKGATRVQVLDTAIGADNVAALYSPEGRTPNVSQVGIAQAQVTTTNVPADLEGMAEDTVYAFESATDNFYAGLDDASQASVAERVALQDAKAGVWLTTVHHDTTKLPISASVSEKLSQKVGTMISISNANVYEWLHDRGYDFESNRRVGLGDIDVDVYYEHMLTDRFTFEVCAKAKLPTASGNDYAGNPYRAHLGNGEHFEIGGGVRFGGEMFSWLHLNLDGNYMFALEGTEHRCAAPTGSLIRNIGPVVDADVSWSTVVANADVTLVHPQTNDLTVSLGYQFMYKDQDKINFKLASVDSWLGKIYDSGDYTLDNTMAIDGKLLARNTERYAHRAKINMTYHFSDWFTMGLGGAFTFAGQNAPKSLDWFYHCSATF
ncbi:MAG: hypothetical protein PVJ92_01530 [Candidatus Dependentiae bacterium]|jgi:hypothetical protein